MKGGFGIVLAWAVMLAAGGLSAPAQEVLTRPEPLESELAPIPRTVQSGPVLPAPSQFAPQPVIVPAEPIRGGEPWDCWVVSTRDLQGPEFLEQQGQAHLKFYHYQTGQRVRQGGESDFMASLDPHRPVCFFIHGGYYTFGDVLHESRVVDNWLKSGGAAPSPQLVCFTWPSETKAPIVPLDVLVLARRSAIHGAFLAALINRMPRQVPVSLLGHSFGGRTVAATLHVMGGGVLEEIPRECDYGPVVPRRTRGVLLVPAIDHHWFNPGERYGLAPVAVEKMLVMTNSVDPVLPLYPLRKPLTARAMGQGGLSRVDRALIGPLHTRVQEFDIARHAGLKHNLDGFYTRPVLARPVVPFVTFVDVSP